MAAKKYKLTDATIEIDGHILHRICALRNFSDVKVGDLGGYVENESNLSHEGRCWVYDSAHVYGRAKVSENGLVKGVSTVFDDAKVMDYAMVDGKARVCEKATICGYGLVYGSATISGEAIVCDWADVGGGAKISGSDRIDGQTAIFGC